MPTVVWKGKSTLFTAGVNTVLVEQPDSPQYKFGDRSTCVRTFKGLHSLCLTSAVGKGTIGTGDMTGWVVSECEVRREPKQVGTLVITYEAASSGGTGALTVPPDEVGLVPFDTNPRVETHPAFAALTDAQRRDVRLAVDSQSDEVQAEKLAGLSGSALLLAQKLAKGVETWYQAGWTYTWSQYSYDLPSSMDAGGYVDTPGGPLGSLLASNPDISWLRQADSMDPGAYPYKITYTWVGAIVEWDSDLY